LNGPLDRSEPLKRRPGRLFEAARDRAKPQEGRGPRKRNRRSGGRNPWRPKPESAPDLNRPGRTARRQKRWEGRNPGSGCAGGGKPGGSPADRQVL